MEIRGKYMNEMMNAVTFKDIATYEIGARPAPKIVKPDDVLVAMEACSICGTDVHLLADPPGFLGTKGIVLGHECVGKVEAVGSHVGGLKPGDRVVLEPNVACGYCDYCRMGVPNMCLNDKILGVTIDGVFADYFVAPEKALVKIPQEMPAEIAVFAEPVNCVMGAMSKIRLLPGENVLVLGAGPIGLYFTMLLKSNGAGKVIVSETSEFRAEYAKKCGADLVINPMKENLSDVVKQHTGGLGADVTVDAVGVLMPDAVAATAGPAESCFSDKMVQSKKPFAKTILHAMASPSLVTTSDCSPLPLQSNYWQQVCSQLRRSSPTSCHCLNFQPV